MNKEKEKIRILYLNVDQYEPHSLNIDDDLHEFYKLIKCDLVEIVNRKIGSRRFSVICDEEGLMKEDIVVSAINKKGEPMFVGNLIIASAETGEDGELKGLTNEEFLYLRQFVKIMCTYKKPEGYNVLTNCEF